MESKGHHHPPRGGLHNHRHSGERRPLAGRNVHPEGTGNGASPCHAHSNALRGSHANIPPRETVAKLHTQWGQRAGPSPFESKGDASERSEIAGDMRAGMRGQLDSTDQSSPASVASIKDLQARETRANGLRYTHPTNTPPTTESPPPQAVSDRNSSPLAATCDLASHDIHEIRQWYRTHHDPQAARRQNLHVKQRFRPHIRNPQPHRNDLRIDRNSSRISRCKRR